ncbi:hypothetical protein [Paenarthrobacter sp. CAP02]|uniref:hypothetical protein n=1 Tax=Paenarthrobacter sp. CAP02 TaxID=3158144 RepID=UPI0032DA7CBC
MARYLVTITNVVEIEQEDLQEAALDFPTSLEVIRQNAPYAVGTTANPLHAGNLLGMELHTQLMMLLRGRNVVPSLPTVSVEQLPEQTEEA